MVTLNDFDKRTQEEKQKEQALRLVNFIKQEHPNFWEVLMETYYGEKDEL